MTIIGVLLTVLLAGLGYLIARINTRIDGLSAKIDDLDHRLTADIRELSNRVARIEGHLFGVPAQPVASPTTPAQDPVASPPAEATPATV